MSTRKTRDLVQLVQRRATQPNSSYEAEQLIQLGADIKAPVEGSSMIDSVISQMNRQTDPWQAQNCMNLYKVLQNRASILLGNSVLSKDGGDVAEIIKLLQLQAKAYQTEHFGPLGLLGKLLKQEEIPIRLEIVNILIKNYGTDRLHMMDIDDQGQTCLSLSKNNSKCPKVVQEQLQNTFDTILNQIPITHPQINVDEVQQWIYRGANPETIDEQGNTVLCNAVIATNLQLVDKLIAVGCNIAHTNKKHRTPLEIAENLSQKNPQIEAILKTQYNNMKLKELIETKKSFLTSDEIHELLESGAKINAPFAKGSTPLHLLIANEGTPEMITTFVNDFHADPSTMDIHGHRPVEMCILFDQEPFDVLRTFLQLQKIASDTYYNTKLNKSILQFAQEQKRPEAVVKIIQEALNLRLWNLITQANDKDEHNRSLTPDLHQLTRFGAQINHKHSDNDYHDWTVLHLACKISTRNFVQYLIEQEKADHTLKNGNGDSPLSVAAEYGQLPFVQYLHRTLNAQLNIPNSDGQTPLHLAAANHHLPVVRYLVHWDADHEAKNAANQTPIDLARINISKKRNNQTIDKALIVFLEQLICPDEDLIIQRAADSRKSVEDIDTCEMVKPIVPAPIQQASIGDEEQLGLKTPKGSLFGTINEELLKAAREGLLDLATKSIAEGANICYKKNNLNAYQTARVASGNYYNKSIAPQTKPWEAPEYQQKLNACQQIMELIRQMAYKRLLRGIDISSAYHILAFHQAGAPLPGNLLNYCCQKSDNVQIIQYLIDNSEDNLRAMFDYTTDDSPYRIAKKNKFHNVASYLKYRLSIECTKAIQNNDLDKVKKLIQAGASVEMHDTNNLQVALGHKNAALVEILCKNGVKIPKEWRQSTEITLPKYACKELESDVILAINRSLVNRRLRLAAAQGDSITLTRCLHLSADIDSENCYGSTALLCSIQHGNYFSIVHALVSRGGSILHSNEDEPMSLIALTKELKYEQITEYLSKELNNKFLQAIQNKDDAVMKFERLGPDFNYQDEQGRTPLHYAVQFHGLKLVDWLCSCGSTPTIADIDGNYPMIDAAEKGDYAVVKLFATKYPTTKQQKNRAGHTPLQIAEALGLKNMAHFLRTGRSDLDLIEDDEPKSNGPRHTRENLIDAASKGHVKLIREFIEDPYDSIDEKRRLCLELLAAAQKENQPDIIGILQAYYESKLKGQLPSDIQRGGAITLHERYKKILLGFLTGLSQVIADSSVILDPADPNTYKELFSNLIANRRKRSEEIDQVNSELDVKRLSDADMRRIEDKVANIDHEFNKIQEEKTILEQEIHKVSDELNEQKQLTAIQREELFKQREEHRKQLSVYESSLLLYELQREATMARQKTMKFIHETESGLFSTKSGDPGPITLVPFMDVISLAVRSTIDKVASKLDKQKQKQELYNILTLGNIEELNRLASDTASLLTLYYKEQIESIDIFNKVKVSGLFGNKIRWIKENLIDISPEKKEEMPIVVVAKYITAWIIEAMKQGGKRHKDIVTTNEKKEMPLDIDMSLSHQIWFRVAKTNYAAENTITDFIEKNAGQLKIPIKISTDNNDKVVYVELRYLIGYVSIVDGNGKIYKYVPQESSKKDLLDLSLYGYVYIKPFLDDDQMLKEITESRNMTATNETLAEKLDELKKIEEYVIVFKNQINQKRESFIIEETVREVAERLRERKVFVNSKDLESILKESQERIENQIRVIKDNIEEKVTYYQTSIDAASEKLEQGVAQAQESLKTDNDKHYRDALHKINDQLKQIEKNLGKRITERINTIEEELKVKYAEIQTIVENARTDVNQALKQTNQAADTCEKSAQRVEQASAHVIKLTEMTEQRRQEFQNIMDKYQTKIDQTITEQKESCQRVAAEQKELYERTIMELRAKVQQDFESKRASIEKTEQSAKESARSAKESADSAKSTQNDTRQQLEQQKAESKALVKENVRLNAEANDAKRQAQQAANSLADANEKIDKFQKKNDDLQRKNEDLHKKINEIQKKLDRQQDQIDKILKKMDK